jgi:integrase
MDNIEFMSGKRRNSSLPPHLEEKRGNYYYVIKIHGKPKWYSLQTRDISVALKKWAELEGHLLKSKNSLLPHVNNDNKIVFSVLCERYQKEVTAHKSERTQKDEKRFIAFLVKQFGDKIVSDISRQEIIRYHDSLRATPYEANHRLAVLHHILGKAVDWGFIENNCTDNIKRFKQQRHKLKLTPEILFEQIYPNADLKLKAAIMLGFFLAQHEKEVKNIQWSNIDLDKRKVEFIRKKTGESLVIHINETLYQFLCYLKSQRSIVTKYVIYHYDFKNNKFVPYRSFISLWRKALMKAGFKHGEYKFKELRHLANTCMKGAGITVDKRMAVTGHTDIKSNEIYTHKVVEDSIAATNSLNVFRPAKF